MAFLQSFGTVTCFNAKSYIQSNHSITASPIYLRITPVMSLMPRTFPIFSFLIAFYISFLSISLCRHGCPILISTSTPDILHLIALNNTVFHAVSSYFAQHCITLLPFAPSFLLIMSNTDVCFLSLSAAWTDLASSILLSLSSRFSTSSNSSPLDASRSSIQRSIKKLLFNNNKKVNTRE